MAVLLLVNSAPLITELLYTWTYIIVAYSLYDLNPFLFPIQVVMVIAQIKQWPVVKFMTTRSCPRNLGVEGEELMEVLGEAASTSQQHG